MLLWLTRKYPPRVGGMETMSYELTRHLGRRFPIEVLAWGRSQRSLPIFLAQILQTAVRLKRRGVPIRGIHLGDVLLAPFGLIVGRLFPNATRTITAHGLDLTYASPIYQRTIRACLPHFTRVFCISEATRAECLRRGVESARTRVIPVGVAERAQSCRPDLAERAEARHQAERRFQLGFEDGPIILTVGRLVERKGVAWLIEKVIPGLVKLIPNLSYLVVGGGNDRRIRQAIRQAEAERPVQLLGQLSDSDLNLAFAAADLFVMPNIPITNDPEGFGIAGLDASLAGLWVFAAQLQGIPDAILDGANGTLLPPADPAIWRTTLGEALQSPLELRRRGDQGRQVTRAHFAWPAIADQWDREFARLGMVR